MTKLIWKLKELSLPNGVLAYYYRHQAELDDYLQSRRQEADMCQQEIEATQLTFAELKARLQARRNADHAPPAQ